MKLATLALASVFALSSTFALAQTRYQYPSHHKYKTGYKYRSGVNTYGRHGPRQLRSVLRQPEQQRRLGWRLGRRYLQAVRVKRRVSAGLFCALFDRSSAAP